MKCKYCGSENPDNAYTCSACGASFSSQWQQPQQNAQQAQQNENNQNYQQPGYNQNYQQQGYNQNYQQPGYNQGYGPGYNQGYGQQYNSPVYRESSGAHTIALIGLLVGIFINRLAGIVCGAIAVSKAKNCLRRGYDPQAVSAKKIGIAAIVVSSLMIVGSFILVLCWIIFGLSFGGYTFDSVYDYNNYYDIVMNSLSLIKSII